MSYIIHFLVNSVEPLALDHVLVEDVLSVVGLLTVLAGKRSINDTK
jgi:hypothetical protein